MLTKAQVAKFLTLVIVPGLVAFAAPWLALHVHLFETFHISQRSIAGALTALGIFAVSGLVTFLAAHHVLKGTYGDEPVLGRNDHT